MDSDLTSRIVSQHSPQCTTQLFFLHQNKRSPAFEQTQRTLLNIRPQPKHTSVLLTRWSLEHSDFHYSFTESRPNKATSNWTLFAVKPPERLIKNWFVNHVRLCCYLSCTVVLFILVEQTKLFLRASMPNMQCHNACFLPFV